MTMFAIMDALREVGDVIQQGDDKHGVNQWCRADPDGELSIDHAKGAERHLSKRIGEEYTAPSIREEESGMRHLAHAAARCLIALQLEIDRERYAKGTVAAEKDS